jgi:hypothetical protein
MNGAIDGNVRAKLVKILTRLASDHAGERDAAAIAAHDLMQRHGLDWRDLIEPQPSTRDQLEYLHTNLDVLLWTERRIVKSAWRQMRSPRGAQSE